MWPFKSEDHGYKAVANDESEDSDVKEARETCQKQQKRSRYRLVVAAIVSLLLGVFVAAVVIAPYHDIPASPDVGTDEGRKHQIQHDEHCGHRREWRTLSPIEQQEYISAVLCLRTQPSVLASESNKTAYDDFPWIHSHVGYFTHHSAPFLPWHRYFLHIYEITLRDKCGYTGGLVYWDWTLDSDALENSPVFNPETGFGGDGEVDGEITVSRTGRCVVDGPFAGIIADYYDVKYQPHCLSRGFRDLEGNLGHIDGHDIAPESIDEVLSLGSYEDFVASMESRVHDVIPYGISGDFETFTAPYGNCPIASFCKHMLMRVHRSTLLSASYPARSALVALATEAAEKGLGGLRWPQGAALN